MFDESLPGDRDRLVGTIRHYLIPSLETPDKPLLVVFAGPTGSGKSTLINSLAGRDLSPAGWVRPTTSVPVVLAIDHEVAGAVRGVDAEVVIGRAAILRHMTLVDTPDIDSTATGHRAIAERLVDQADIVVFVTTALRYADQVPWEVLRRAQSRGATVIPVLNRVGVGSGAVLPDFHRRLSSGGVTEHPLRIPEHHLTPLAQQVPSLAVRDLRRRLYRVAAARREHRAKVVNRVFNAMFDQVALLSDRVAQLAGALAVEADRMETGMTAAGRVEFPSIETPNLLLASVRAGIGRWRRRNRPPVVETELWRETTTTTLVAHLETRLRRAVADLGAALLDQGITLAVLTEDAGTRLSAEVGGWLDEVEAETAGDRHPRLAQVVLAGAAVTPVDDSLSRAALGAEHQARTGAARAQLVARIEGVFDFYGARMAERWRKTTGEPDAEDLGPRLAAVAAGYQFADA